MVHSAMEQLSNPAVIGPALAGGALLGLAAALLVVFNGRVAGVSGIITGLMRGPVGERGWRLAFVIGLVAAPLAWVALVDPSAGDPGPLASLPVLAIAGLLVGLGAGIGGGCTSGHGVCGLARGSARSLVATGVFMVTAAVTVFVIRHVLGG